MACLEAMDGRVEASEAHEFGEGRGGCASGPRLAVRVPMRKEEAQGGADLVVARERLAPSGNAHEGREVTAIATYYATVGVNKVTVPWEIVPSIWLTAPTSIEKRIKSTS